MARPRVPTNVLDARGAFKKHPERRPDASVTPTVHGDLGGPPDWLTEGQTAVWDELLSTMPEGVGSGADRVPFELMVRLTDQMRRNELNNPAHMAQLRALLGSFAMTPADRTKVQVKKPEGNGNPFACLRKPAG